MPEYYEKTYWDERFVTESEFEWLMGPDELEEFVYPLLRLPSSTAEPSFKVLNAGCGTSNFPKDFVERFPATVISVDYSPNSVNKLSARFSSLPNLQFLVDDLLTLDQFNEQSIDLIFDKSTFDALACSGSTEILETYQKSLRRVVKDKGQWCCISYSDRTDYIVEDIWELVQKVEVVREPAGRDGVARPEIQHYVHVLEPVP